MPNTKAKLDRLRQRLGAAKDVNPASVDQSGDIAPYSIPAEDRETFSNIASQEDVLRTTAILDDNTASAVEQSDDTASAVIPQPPAPTQDIQPSIQPPSIEEVVGNSGSQVNEIIVSESDGGGELGAALKEYNKVVGVAMDAYRKEKKSLKQRELWDGIIKGVGLMAAGLYGMKTGTDMGGVKVNTTDWASNLRNAQAELQSALGQAGRSFNMKKGIGEAVERRNQQMWDRSFKIAREKRLAESSMADLKARTAAAGAKKQTGIDKKQAEEDKAEAKRSAAEAKEIARLEKEMKKEIAILAKENTGEESKAVGKRNIEALNEKYRNLTGESFADTSDTPGMLWGTNPRKPSEMLLGGGGGGMPAPADNSGDVKMVSPDGKTYIIPAENVQKALSGGWTRG